MLLCNRQSKVRLYQFYKQFPEKEQQKFLREAMSLVLSRSERFCKFIEWKKYKLVYKRYASLYFIFCIDQDDNELITLEVIHMMVELLDKFFSNVCELDLVFNFHKAFFLLNEFIVAGEIVESSKRQLIRLVNTQETLNEQALAKLKLEM